MIFEAVSFSAAHLAVIGQLSANGRSVSPNDWEEASLREVKAHIKRHYIAAQGTRCCYCNRHLGSDNHRVWDIEHVVPRSSHCRFMFEPRNLAASCPDCNLHKADKKVLNNENRKSYPDGSSHFKIIHPHYDRFADHIFNSQYIYVGKTEKGKATIYACDLLRFAQKYIDWTTEIGDDRFEDEVDTVMRGGLHGALEVQRLQAILDD